MLLAKAKVKKVNRLKNHRRIPLKSPHQIKILLRRVILYKITISLNLWILLKKSIFQTNNFFF